MTATPETINARLAALLTLAAPTQRKVLTANPYDEQEQAEVFAHRELGREIIKLANNPYQTPRERIQNVNRFLSKFPASYVRDYNDRNTTERQHAENEAELEFAKKFRRILHSPVVAQS